MNSTRPRFRLPNPEQEHPDGFRRSRRAVEQQYPHAIEVNTDHSGVVYLRLPGAPVISVDRRAWSEFLHGAKRGEFG